jgi:methionyl aminopeptidase
LLVTTDELDAVARAAFVAPKFTYTGSLRPHWVSPMRSVPPHIKKPEYYATGQPVSEINDRNSAKLYINSPAEIAGIKAACKIGRDVLDMAGRMVRPGVTTEEIDRAVHEMTIAAGAYPSPLNYYNFPKSCCTYESSRS